MQTALQPLLARLPILPEESLFSFLIRISRSNSYTSLNILWDLILGDVDPRTQERCIKDNLFSPFKGEIYSRIATLTMIDPFTLYKNTYHRFALLLAPPPRSVKHLMLPDKTLVPCLPNGREQPQIRPSSISQFCPKCLQENPYYPLCWVPVALSACLKHKCLLVDQCPNCHKKVSLYSVTTSECSQCKSDLTGAEIISIASDEIGLRAQRILQSWFMEYVTPEYEISNLPQQSPAVLYRVIEGIRDSIEARKYGNWPYFHYLSSYPNSLTLTDREGEQIFTPYESYCMYTTAYKAIMNWPESFFAFLLGYSYEIDCGTQNIRFEETIKDKLLTGFPQDHLGVLYTQWIKQQWSYPEFKFVQEAVDYHIADKYWLENFSMRTYFYKTRPHLVEHDKYVSIEAAANFLNISPEVVKLLQRNKILTQIVENGCELLDKKEVLYYQRGSLITEEKAGLLMHVPTRIISELAELGIVELDSKNHCGSYYKMSAIIIFLEKLSKYVKVYSHQELAEKGPWVDFVKAAHIFTYKEALQEVTIFLQILAGNLTVYHSSEGGLQLKSLLFAPQDFQRCIAYLRDRSRWLEHKEVLRLLGIKDLTLIRWIKDGRILPIAIYRFTKYFDAEKVHELCSMYITRKEATRILAVNVPTLQNWIRANQISEVLIHDPSGEGEDAHIFDKEQLIQWRNDRFTSNEAAQALGVTKTILYRWVKEGKLRPLYTIHGNQCWFFKQDVLKLKS